MPYYDFECPHGHKFEKLVKVGQDKVFCDECNLEGLMSEAKKVLSTKAPSAQFHGHGWTPPKLERK